MLRCKSIVFGLLVCWISSCTDLHHTYKAPSPWNKSKDSPGIEFRARCKGQTFQGSKFFKWEVEVKNQYPQCADMKITIADRSNQKISESYQVSVIAGDVKKVTFYNVKIPDSYPHKIMISSVTL